MNPESFHRASPAAGVLLVNLGTPAAPTPAAIRRYLAQFLADRRVVNLPRALWLPILYLFILPLRPRRLAHAYAQIWTAQGSPLLAISQAQAEALRRTLASARECPIPVALAMTYGAPDLAGALDQLAAQQVRRLLVLPLYPQYSASTTAAALDALFGALRRRTWLPELRTVNSYHDDPGYIDALAASVRRHWQSHGRGERLLLSFHGVPQQYVLDGDPYYCHCRKTARLLAERLELPEAQCEVAFQSRFGRQPWVQPYTDATVQRLARAGVKTLDVLCPGFAADCLETLEEVQLRYAAAFARAGGTALRYIPALNDDPAHIDVLAGIVRRHLAGWLPEPEDAGQVQARLQRAAAAAPAFGGERA
ncbi:MAG: ferrochelatase [Nevskia sp.]|nr:ferrochelatase [Nevskia sp.]